MFFAFILILFTSFFILKASAVSLISVSHSLSNNGVSVEADHVIEFTTPSGVSAGETIIFTFPDGFSTGTVDYTDIDLMDDGVNLDLAEFASGAVWGARISGSDLIISSDTGTIAPASVVTIKIGKNAEFGVAGDSCFTNPALAGSYAIIISGTFSDRGVSAVAINDSSNVSISATVFSSVQAIIQWAVPEFRVGAPETNDDTDFYIFVDTEADGDNNVLFRSAIYTTDVAGRYLTPIDMPLVNPGNYDVFIKTDQHLSKKLNNIGLTGAVNTLNFTQSDNSAPKGAIVLDAGDIAGIGSVENFGDDVVNSIDLSVMLGNIDVDDPTGRTQRSNLNQDIIINSVDLSILLDNLDMEGDRS